MGSLTDLKLDSPKEVEADFEWEVEYNGLLELV